MKADKICLMGREYVDAFGNPVYTGVCLDNIYVLRTPYVVYYDGELIRFKISAKVYRQFYRGVGPVTFKLVRPEGDKDRYIICRAVITGYVPEKWWIFKRRFGEVHFVVVSILNNSLID